VSNYLSGGDRFFSNGCVQVAVFAFYDGIHGPLNQPQISCIVKTISPVACGVVAERLV
jgi:hypothetical protein